MGILRDRVANTAVTRVYRAFVISVDNPPRGSANAGHAKIWIREVGVPADTPPREVNPPSPIPVDDYGSGAVSLPDPGSQCLVFESEDLDIAQILTYIALPGMSVFGNLSTEKPGIGGFFTKIGGKFKTVIGQTKSGVIKLMAGQFSNIKINAKQEKVDISAKNYNKVSATGFQSDIFEENTSTPLIAESRTRHMSVYTQSKESKRESDVSSIQSGLGTEEVSLIPLVNNYVGKAVIRAGQVSNKSHGYYGQPTHTYEIDTRQSTGASSTQKDTVTNFKLGYQGEHFPNSTTTWNSGGAMVEMTAKRNVPMDISSYVFRYGKSLGDSGSKFPDASPTALPGGEKLKGEIFRHQILDGLNYGIPFGTPIVNPLGEGLGYDRSLVTSAERVYSESFGVLDSTLLVGDEEYGSI